MGCAQSNPNVQKPDATGVPATGIDGKAPVTTTAGATTTTPVANATQNATPNPTANPVKKP